MIQDKQKGYLPAKWMHLGKIEFRGLWVIARKLELEQSTNWRDTKSTCEYIMETFNRFGIDYPTKGQQSWSDYGMQMNSFLRYSLKEWVKKGD